MQKTLSITAVFARADGDEQSEFQTLIYSPVFRQSPAPATPWPVRSAFDVHQASVISPRAARTLALLTAPQRQEVHSFESLLKALTLGCAASVEPPGAPLSAAQPAWERRPRRALPRATGQKRRQTVAANWI